MRRAEAWVLVCSAACGGSDAVSPPPDPGPLPAELAGRIERVNLTIAEDETHRVTGNTVLVVDSTFIMAGTLEVAPGASLTLYAGKLLRITGILDGDSASEYVIGGGRVEIEGETQVSARITASDRVRGRLKADGPILFAAQFVVLSNAHVTAGSGANGTEPDRDGRRGSNLEIGTEVAAAKLVSNTLKTVNRTAGVLIDGSFVYGGLGGGGFDVVRREDGEVAANTWSGRGGNGGPGGDLIITAELLEVRRSTVWPGGGGLGGSVIQNEEDSLRSGSGPGGRGESLDARIGDGGKGGNLHITAVTFPIADHIRQGDHGAPGFAFFEGGNGAGGGAGAVFRIRLGRAGAPGGVIVPTGVAVSTGGRAGNVHVSVSRALNGGDADDPQETGGAGGVLIVSGPDGEVAVADLLTLDQVGNGGRGFNGCLDPRQNGTPGGPGGERDLAIAAAVLAEYDKSWSGGSGGDGFPLVGEGGERGSQRDGPGGPMPLGAPGMRGKPCPPQTGTQKKVAIANHSSGLSLATADGALSSGTPFSMPGAVSVRQLGDNASHLVVGTTAPALHVVTLAEDGGAAISGTRPMASAVFELATVSGCVQVAQPDHLLFLDSELNVITDLQALELKRIIEGRNVLYAHAGDAVRTYSVDPGSCAGTPAESAPVVIPDLRSIASPARRAVQGTQAWLYGLVTPATGPGSVVAIPLQNELPAGSPVTTPLSTRPFDIKLNPGGTRVHLTHDLGQFVTVRAMQDGTVTEPVTTTLTGIDRSDFLVADLAGIPEIRLVYTDVSSPTRGRVCMVLLDAEGIPSGDPVCEQNSTRPRPDSDLAVLRPLPTGSAAVPSPVRRTH